MNQALKGASTAKGRTREANWLKYKAARGKVREVKGIEL